VANPGDPDGYVPWRNKRIHAPVPPGGFDPPSPKVQKEMERAAQRRARELLTVERLAVPVMVLVAVGTVVVIIIAVATHH
jgi:hypothetical protein